jgi:putative membrane protein
VKPIILCIDRDDDLGRNTGMRGPIIGVDRNLDAAKKLGLRDPEDTDVNALFGAVKLARELNTEVVTLTGDRNVGLVSDRRIAEQLEKVVEKLDPESVIVVTDGLDDEQVIPIIQSRVKIDSVQTVVVRQSKELEKAYFKLTHFLKEISDDPALARLIFGVPGMALILLAVGGVQALSLILGLVGLYLVVRGMGWEEEAFRRLNEFLKSLSVDRISTLVYVISFIMLFVSLSYGYSDFQQNIGGFTNPKSSLNTLSLLVLNSPAIEYFIWALIIAVLAKTIDEWSRSRFIQVRRLIILMGFIGLVSFITKSGAQFLLDETYVFGRFVLNSIFGVVVFAILTKVTELMFKSEIIAIKDIIYSIKGLKVFDVEGRELGKVSRVYVEDMKLDGIRVGHKHIDADNIESVENVIVVNPED